MDSETYNKSYAGGKWWVDQCGWGRRFASEEAADAHIALMESLTEARQRAKVAKRSGGSGRAGRKRFWPRLDNPLAPVLE